MDESTLLQTAGSSPPERALSLAQIHAKRFPDLHAQKREAILARALIALGRTREAAEHTAALRGSAYDQANRDSH